MSKPRLRVGSVLEIPLSDGRKAFGRYLHRDSQMGPILQVYDLVLKNHEEVNLEILTVAKDLFKPLFVGIGAAVRSGIWKIIGYLPVEDFVYPGFLRPIWSGEPPIVYHWYFWDGENRIDLGAKLPEQYKEHEYIGTFAAQDIAKRIESGEESFVKKLIAGEQKDEPG